MSASIQVLTRAIQPLEILPRKDAPMCLAEIAEASGLPKAAPIRSARPGSSCLPSASPSSTRLKASGPTPLPRPNSYGYEREAVLPRSRRRLHARGNHAAGHCHRPARRHRHAPRCGPCRRVPRFGRFRLHDRAGAERHRGANHRALAFPPLPSFRMAFPRRPLSPFFSAFLSVFRASSTSKRRAAQ